jgi:hypothetical protein
MPNNLNTISPNKSQIIKVHIQFTHYDERIFILLDMIISKIFPNRSVNRLFVLPTKIKK